MPRPHPLIGKTAPPLSLPDSNGQTYSLSPDSLTQPVVIFFYPKAGTYGCTKEACEFRDALAENQSFKTTKAQVIGISGDSVEKQKEFVQRQKLTYPVLSDAKGEARKAYQVGKSLLGLSENRMTFVIDSKGVVRDVHEGTLNFWSHVKFVTKWLEQLEDEAKPKETPREPGLITEPGLATEPSPDREPPVAATGPALSVPADESPDVSPVDANNSERENLVKAAAAVQG